MAICSMCGNESQGRFCIHCGHSLNGDGSHIHVEVQPPYTPPPPPPVDESAGPVPQQYPPPPPSPLNELPLYTHPVYDPQPQDPWQARSNKRWKSAAIWVLVAGLVLVIVGTAAAYGLGGWYNDLLKNVDADLLSGLYDYGDETAYEELGPGFLDPSTGWYTSGIYIVGRDLAPGEYYFLKSPDTFEYYSSIDLHSFEGADDFLHYAYIDNNYFLTLHEGQELQVYDADFVESSKAHIKEKPVSGAMRIGLDIPAGLYSIKPVGEWSGYITIYSGTDLSLADSQLETRGFTRITQIELYEGEYLVLEDAEIIWPQSNTI